MSRTRITPDPLQRWRNFTRSTVSKADRMACVNIMIASLALGGAERIVHETISTLQSRAARGTLFVLKDVGLQYTVNTAGLFEVHRWKASYRESRLRETADRVLR